MTVNVLLAMELASFKNSNPPKGILYTSTALR